MCNIALYAKYTFRYRIYIEIQCHSSESKQVVEQLRVEVKSLKIAKYGLKQQIVWAKQKTIENKSLPLWNKAISMEDINRLKVVLVEKKRTARWLSMQMGVNPSTVSKWCTNSSQPDVASLLKIADLLEVDIKELLVREYEQFLLSKIKN